MKLRLLFILFCTMITGLKAVAQVPKEKMTQDEKQEKNMARQDRINTKNDYAVFRRLATSSKEFNDEKKKVPKLQADSKQPVKVVVTIDSLDEGDTATKTITGYIVQNVGDNATLMYEIVYSRQLKKIITMQKTQEAIEAEKAEKEEKEEKAEAKKPGAKPAVHKKTGDDDDDDEPEDKPSKTKEKDDD